MSLAAMTAANARLGYTRPLNSTSSGTLLRMPSRSGAAFKKPDAPAAFASDGRLQTVPVARKNGDASVSPLRWTMATERG